MPDPGRSTISTIFMIRPAGRLSMTNQPTSSSAAAAVERPAPDIPVTTTNSLTPHRPLPTSLAHALVHGETDAVGQPGQGLELLERRRPHRVDPAQLLDQAGLAGRPETGDVVEDAARHPLAPPLAVERDGEAVRLVAHPLQEVERVRAAAQAHRVRRARPVDLLELLGQRRQLDLVLEPELAHHPLGHAELALAAVDQRAGWAGRRSGAAARPPAPPAPP